MSVLRYSSIACLLVFLYACNAYNLKQPAFVSFNCEITSPVNEAAAKIEQGYFYLDKISVLGERLEGPNIALEQVQSADKLLLANKTSLGISMDIPQGDYTKLEVKIDVNENKLPAMQFNGTFLKDGTTYPLIIYWRDNIATSFVYDGIISLKKKKTYESYLAIDQSKLLDGIDWTNAVLTPVEDGMEMRVTSVVNEAIFGVITNNLAKALAFKIQE